MNPIVEAAVRDFLNAQYLTYDKTFDCWTGEIYADYRDELSDTTIKEIFDADSPQDALYEKLDAAYFDAPWDYNKELIHELKQIWHKNDEVPEWDSEIASEISDFVQEKVMWNWPYDHYANQMVEVDLILDTGDGNYDFVLNCVYPHYNGTKGETINNRASIVWLAKQMGYTKQQLNNALRYNQFEGSKFLKSITEEVLNCTSHMNALAFFVSMSVQDCIELNKRVEKAKGDLPSYKAHESNSKDFITIPKGTCCGLYDSWSGAGSILEVEIEKDIELPLKLVSSAQPDGCRGYGIKDIYGIMSSFWRPL